jgi:P-type Ca2+ transporter type 2C
VERYLQEHFDVPAKNPSEEAQRRWRSAVGTIIKNRRRRFRMVPDLDRRQQDEETRRSIQVVPDLNTAQASPLSA